MKGIMLTGALLIILGAAALIFGSISYTTDETVLDVGPLEAEVEKERTIPLSPVLGLVAVAAGLGLVFVAKKRS
jgi:TRAP-type C4-dicarboxylate transport system permease large subunit